MSLIENIQRENLNPMEEAAGVQRLLEEFKMTHEQAADAVGRSRSATTNLLRLLKLAKPVQEMLMEGALEMGHARALLALDGARQIEAGNRVAAKGLSVRETEAMVQQLLRGPTARRKHKGDRVQIFFMRSGSAYNFSINAIYKKAKPIPKQIILPAI